MENILNSILAVSGNYYPIYKALSIICVVLAAICALFVVVVVLMQQGNSNGVSALGGNTDTFYGKNKSKTLEHKLKVLTVISIVVIAVLMVAFYLLELIPYNVAG